jgi:hypothetical protein
MGDVVTWQGDATVAQYMWGEVAEQGQAGSPGSGGASPYLPGFPRCLACYPEKSIVRLVATRDTLANLPVPPRMIGSWICQRDFDSKFSQRLSVDESVSFSPSRHWRSSSMLSGPMRANTWGDSQST